MRPLFGVRAIAEASGLHAHQVLAMVQSGRGGVLAGRIAAQQIDRGRPERDDLDWDDFIRSATEITHRVDWDEFIRSATEIQ